MPIYIPTPADYDDAPRYKTKQRGIAYIFNVVTELDKTPLNEWTTEHVDQWAKHLCVYADERIKNARYEIKRRWRMLNDPVFAHARRAHKNSPAGRVRARALRDERLTYATPAWADKDAMQAFYDEAHRLELTTGETYHVDLIFPLVWIEDEGNHIGCCLNWEANLSPEKASVNLKKGCRYNP